MKSPIAKTLFMGVLAVVAAMIASAFYPWPERVVESDLVGKPLFAEFDVSSVRSMAITNYNLDRNGFDRMELRRNGEKWIIPAYKNFVATNSGQLGRAVNSLSNLTVLENRSNDQQDHVEYGVVDPSEYESSTNRASLGTKIVLEDRNKRELASLIVGSPLRGGREGDADGGSTKSKYFVRVPGQPSVYVVEFDPNALATEFSRWVSPNLLGLSQQLSVDSIEIDDYRLDRDKLANAKKKWSYRASIDAETGSVKIETLKDGTDDSDPWIEAKATQTQLGQLGQFGSSITNLRFTDVQKKSSDVAALLRKRSPADGEEAVLKSLNEFGFVKTGFEKYFEFDATDGEVIVRTGDGVRVTVLIGGLVENQTGGELSLNHHVMLYASVDETLLPKPNSPQPNDDPQLALKEKKAYLREVEKRNELLLSARSRAADLNQSYADWYYIVSESVIAGLRPELTIEAVDVAEEKKAEGDAETKAEARQESKPQESKSEENKSQENKLQENKSEESKSQESKTQENKKEAAESEVKQ